MNVYRLHFGNNKYPGGNTLYKCVADAQTMAKLFGSPSAAVWTDRQNTPSGMIKAFNAVVTAAQPGDQVVVSYSGHGTQVRDRNGDEPDGLDEAIVAIDLSTILDDTIYVLLQRLNPKAQGFLFSDSCFSGTIQRAMPGVASAHVKKLRKSKIRYLPPALAKPPKRGLPSNKGPQDPVANWVVFGGCTDFEFSYEGPRNGVMTEGVRQNGRRGISVEEHFNGVTSVVAKTGYNQHPQLSCTPAARKWIIPFV